MKKNATFKKMIAAALLMVAGTQVSFAQGAYNNIWVKAFAVPAEGGTVYVDFFLDENEKQFGVTSEFKRSAFIAVDQAFILTKETDGFLLAGVARDVDKNGKYDAETDKQIHVWSNAYFDAVYDPTNYEVSGSSTASMALAEDALATMTQPTDQVLAVFTKGTVARRAIGQEAWGKVYSTKLENTVGDEVTFSAYGDSESKDKVRYFKFSHWTNAAGDTVSTEREMTVTATSMTVYYANFVETTQDEFKQTETDPNKIDWNQGNTDDPWGWLGVKSIKAEGQSNAVYNLQGRKVSKLGKGLYISNGKKVLMR